MAVLIQDTDGFLALSVGTELESPSVFGGVGSGHIRDIQPGQVKGIALQVIILSETAHGGQQLVQAGQVDIRLGLPVQL